MPKLADAVSVIVIISILHAFWSAQATGQINSTADINNLDGVNSQSPAVLLFNDPVSGRDRYLIGSIGANKGNMASRSDIPSYQTMPARNFNERNISRHQKLNEIVDQIRREQQHGNFSINTLILEGGTQRVSGPIDIIDLKDLTIKVRGGNSAIIIDDLSNDIAINIINSDGICIQGLIINRANYGINLNNSHNCNIINNIINDCADGIILNDSNDNNINYNKIYSEKNESTGVCIFNSFLNKFLFNKVFVKNVPYYLSDGSKFNNISIDEMQRSLIIDHNNQYYINKDCGFIRRNSTNSECRYIEITENMNYLELERS